MVAGSQQTQATGGDCCHAGGEGNRGLAIFHGGDAVLQGGHSRV